jgi:hypothetical protein
MAIENLNKHMNLRFINFTIAFWLYSASKKNKTGLQRPPPLRLDCKSFSSAAVAKCALDSFFALHYGKPSPICFQWIELETIDF